MFTDEELVALDPKVRERIELFTNEGARIAVELDKQRLQGPVDVERLKSELIQRRGGG